MPFFTRRGDDGTTGRLGEGRISKTDLRIETVGTLDEASAALGVARAAARDTCTVSILLSVQRDLHQVMAEVAASPENAQQFRFDPERVSWVEQQIQTFTNDVTAPFEFILPGDSTAGAALAVARTVVRRGERRLVELFERGMSTDGVLRHYMNRLSSLLFVLELIENKAAGATTTKARKDEGHPHEP
jgi:cob(I)alamin adenosyltransferase